VAFAKLKVIVPDEWIENELLQTSHPPEPGTLPASLVGIGKCEFFGAIIEMAPRFSWRVSFSDDLHCGS